MDVSSNHGVRQVEFELKKFRNKPRGEIFIFDGIADRILHVLSGQFRHPKHALFGDIQFGFAQRGSQVSESLQFIDKSPAVDILGNPPELGMNHFVGQRLNRTTQRNTGAEENLPFFWRTVTCAEV